jgi:hypothetical protein
MTTIESLFVVDTVSPVVFGAATDQPPGFSPPVRTPQEGGTRYVWSASALGLLPPGASFTFTVSGTVGLVCSPTRICNTAYVGAGNVCRWHHKFTNITTDSGNTVGVMAGFGAKAVTAWLDSSLVVVPSTVQAGQAVVARLTVTNTGAATAYDVTPSLSLVYGSSIPILAGGGSVPAGPIVLAPGGATTFTWSFSPTGSGIVSFTGSVAATDCACGFQIGSTSVKAVTISAPPSGMIDVTGGANGYIDPTKGEQAVIVAYPSGPGLVQVSIYDMNGVLVRSLSQATGGGPVTCRWDGRTSSGVLAPPGGYPIFISGPGLNNTDIIGVLY